MAGSVKCSEITVGWQPFHFLPAERNALHVWHAPLEALLVYKPKLQAILLPEERQAAARYRQRHHQERYIIQHGLLRLLLGWHLGEKVYSLPFVLGTNKKPYLPDNSCYFNISHTEADLLFSIGNVESGVDLEHVNPQFAYQDIASHYFGQAEQQYIAKERNSQQAFFLLWTRKEALLKSSGLGIDDNLPGIPALNGTHQLPPHFGSAHWQTESFSIGNANIGSLSHPAGERTLCFWQVSELEQL